jgi:hypothetical protein
MNELKEAHEIDLAHRLECELLQLMTKQGHMTGI